MRFVPPALLVAAALASPAPAAADVIFDNGLPDEANGSASDFDATTFIADDFVLQAGMNEVRSVTWFGAYGFTDTPTFPDSFTLSIYDNDAGNGTPQVSPSNEFFVGDVGRVATGGFVAGLDLYRYTANLAAPLVLTAGESHWLSIVNETSADTDDDWFWATSDELAGNGAQRGNPSFSWNTVNREYAFSLSDTAAIPEPGTWGLVGLAVACGGVLRRRRGRVAA